MDLFLSSIRAGLPEMSLVMGIITAVIAHSKNRNAFLWFIIGLLASCLGLIVLLFLPDGEDEIDEFEDEVIVERPLRSDLADALEALPSETASAEWHYEEIIGHTSGPVSRSALAALVDAGSIDGRTLVWHPSLGSTWVPLESFAPKPSA